MKNRFLPIGTVVRLKDSNKSLMITSYCIFPKGLKIEDNDVVDAEKKVFEYGGCLYPEGIFDSNVIHAFDHNQIEEIRFLGYETEEQAELSKALNEGFETIKKQFEEGAL